MVYAVLREEHRLSRGSNQWCSFHVLLWQLDLETISIKCIDEHENAMRSCCYMVRVRECPIIVSLALVCYTLQDN